VRGGGLGPPLQAAPDLERRFAGRRGHALLVAASTGPRWTIAGLAAIAGIVLVRHRANLERLLHHEER